MICFVKHNAGTPVLSANFLTVANSEYVQACYLYPGRSTLANPLRDTIHIVISAFQSQSMSEITKTIQRSHSQGDYRL
ncbi:uncharacterized protein CCR75_000225 [Bremia lactucae]|uniref:Uncharacterized protein n=1 Tax=Bremia lactucae TaxID=4779 RepID=A0A976FED6_BRELC|nr:hypothetical protein CCR75_000225 [Bremia lactucae]